MLPENKVKVETPPAGAGNDFVHQLGVKIARREGGSGYETHLEWFDVSALVHRCKETIDEHPIRVTDIKIPHWTGPSSPM